MKNLSFNKLCFALAALSTTTAAFAESDPPPGGNVPDATSTLGLAVIALGGLIAARRLIGQKKR